MKKAPFNRGNLLSNDPQEERGYEAQDYFQRLSQSWMIVHIVGLRPANVDFRLPCLKVETVNATKTQSV